MVKRIFFWTFSFFVCTTASAQFVATLEIEEPIEGICNNDRVYAIFPMIKGQSEAVCPLSNDKILERLNSEIQFLVDHPRFRGKGMIGLLINCKGEVIQCKMDIKTKSAELDQQIENVFNSLGEWKAAKLRGENVDSSKLFSFKIRKGKIAFN